MAGGEGGEGNGNGNYTGGERTLLRLAFLLFLSSGNEKKDCGNFGWKDCSKALLRLEKAEGGWGRLEPVNCWLWRGSLTGLCSVPYQIICHLCNKPCPGRGDRSGPIFSTSSVQVPAAFSPQKWTDRKGHWSNLEPRVSLGLGKSKVDLVPAGEVSTSIRFPRGT